MQFIDQAEIEVIAGKGGDGVVAFRREKYVPAGGPAGGNGGWGGSVIFRAEMNLQTLLDFRYARTFKAPDGERGGNNNCTGASGEDLIVDVPCGTVIYDKETDEEIGDLITHGQTIRVAAGGKGGLGNKHFLSNKNRAPEYALPGLEGETKQLRLELKLLAEVGLIGLPNAGKSTLISALSAARPKIADYPFTTLIPNLGVVRRPTGDGTVFADIPGLIEGAHQGVGLGHEFLRHIERTRVLVHLVDMNSEDPVKDYQTIQQELLAYGRGLPELPQIIALNKLDTGDREFADFIAEELRKITDHEIMTISAVARTGLEPMLQRIWEILDALNAAEAEQKRLELELVQRAEAEMMARFGTVTLDEINEEE
jgi:GTP-binding protein